MDKEFPLSNKAYWYEHIKNWQRSDLSQRAYCLHAGIKFSSFDYWRRKQRQTNQQEALHESFNNLDVGGFVPIKLKHESQSQWECELEFTNGLRFRWNGSIDIQQLKNVVEMLLR